MSKCFCSNLTGNTHSKHFGSRGKTNASISLKKTCMGYHFYRSKTFKMNIQIHIFHAQILFSYKDYKIQNEFSFLLDVQKSRLKLFSELLCGQFRFTFLSKHQDWNYTFNSPWMHWIVADFICTKYQNLIYDLI